MKKLVVLDYKKGEVHTYSIDEDRMAKREQALINQKLNFIEKMGHNADKCVMITLENDSKIINH